MTTKTIEELNLITDKIIKIAIEVHRTLGPGLLESIYEKAMCHELRTDGIHFANQVVVPILYKGVNLGEQRLDLLVENEVIVEFKAVDRMDPVFKAQVLSYLKLTGKKLGLLINFNVPILKEGIQRVIL